MLRRRRQTFSPRPQTDIENVLVASPRGSALRKSIAQSGTFQPCCPRSSLPALATNQGASIGRHLMQRFCERRLRIGKVDVRADREDPTHGRPINAKVANYAGSIDTVLGFHISCLTISISNRLATSRVISSCASGSIAPLFHRYSQARLSTASSCLPDELSPCRAKFAERELPDVTPLRLITSSHIWR